jgi:hypothetical protein
MLITSDRPVTSWFDVLVLFAWFNKNVHTNVGFGVLTAVVMKSTIVWDITLCSPLKMEAICSPQTSVDFQRTTRRYIPKDSTIHVHTKFVNLFIICFHSKFI